MYIIWNDAMLLSLLFLWVIQGKRVTDNLTLFGKVLLRIFLSIPKRLLVFTTYTQDNSATWMLSYKKEYYFRLWQ